MHQIAIRIEGSVGVPLFIILISALIVIPILAGRAMRRRRGEVSKHAYLTGSTVALGIELGVLALVALAVSDIRPAAKLTWIGAIAVLPLLVGTIRALLSTGPRAATFGKTVAVVLGLELILPVMGLLLYGGSCFSGYGYVEF